MGMRRRLQIGILFNFSKNWLGGVYYILNIIKTLDSLAEKDKPHIFLFYNQELAGFVQTISYPYLTVELWRFPDVFTGTLQSWLTRENRFINDIVGKYPLDGIFPVMDHPVSSRRLSKENIRLISWYADLQHRHYPEFFSRKQRLLREVRLKLMLRNTSHLVVSSQDVAKDFSRFYRLKSSLNLYVYHFVSVIERFEGDEINKLRYMYDLPEDYFIISNQFHNHKNHRVVLKALAKLKKRGTRIHLVITGKFPEGKSSPYIDELKTIINSHGLNELVHFLGVIPRQHQLRLMESARAVIQPSLFEGWSTVIEDAKSLQAPVIASQIPVNREQLGDAGIFFDPHNDDQLADILDTYQKVRSVGMLYEPYEDRIRAAANHFIEIFRTPDTF